MFIQTRGLDSKTDVANVTWKNDFIFRSGVDSVELVHRVWRQLIGCLTEASDERIAIKSSFIKVSMIWILLCFDRGCFLGFD